MGRNVPIHVAGAHLAENWVLSSSDKTLDDAIGEATLEQRTAYLLCSLVKELREVNRKLDMLYPDNRQKYIERKRHTAKHKADRAAYHDKQYQLAMCRLEWFLPVAERLVTRHAPSVKAFQLICKIESSAYRCCHSTHPCPQDFLDYVKALKGPPAQWNFQAFYGIGPKFERTWKQSLANGSGTPNALFGIVDERETKAKEM